MSCFNDIIRPNNNSKYHHATQMFVSLKFGYDDHKSRFNPDCVTSIFVDQTKVSLFCFILFAQESIIDYFKSNFKQRSDRAKCDIANLNVLIGGTQKLLDTAKIETANVMKANPDLESKPSQVNDPKKNAAAKSAAKPAKGKEQEVTPVELNPLEIAKAAEDALEQKIESFRQEIIIREQILNEISKHFKLLQEVKCLTFKDQSIEGGSFIDTNAKLDEPAYSLFPLRKEFLVFGVPEGEVDPALLPPELADSVDNKKKAPEKKGAAPLESSPPGPKPFSLCLELPVGAIIDETELAKMLPPEKPTRIRK